MKKPTLYDVARLSGLSLGTVSGYINGKRVSEKNSAKIKDAIDVLKYMPQSAARSLASGKSYFILLFVMVESPIVSSTWMQELPIVQGISDFLNGSGYSLGIEIADVSKTNENNLALERIVLNRNADGVILISPWKLNDSVLTILKYHKFPYILIGGGDYSENVVDFDNKTSIYDLVCCQYDKGHRKIAFIGGFENQDYVRQRKNGFCAAHQALGLPDPKQYIKYGDYSLESGYAYTMELLEMDESPTMIVCCNDYIAAGAIKAIVSMGLRIPQDIAVSGFDDTTIATIMTPTITSIQVPSYDIGKTAIQELLRKVEDSSYEVQNTYINCKIVYRESTGTSK